MKDIGFFLLWLLCQIPYTFNYYPLEKEHNWGAYEKELPPHLEGSNEPIPNKYWQSPDFREEEPVYLPKKDTKTVEVHRPYRLSPHYKTATRLSYYAYNEDIHSLSCICTTAYKRLTPLGTCAILTTRHIITTASSTWLILKDRLHYKHLENILGFWYDHNQNKFNSSMYMSVSRVHFHPLFHKPEHVNRSHPLPFTFDIAVLATTYNVYGWYAWSSSTSICLRGTSSAKDHASAVPRSELFHLVGYQYIWAYKRKPTVFHKYTYRTGQATVPCPKVEWGWFICIEAHFLKYGIDSGTALHRAFKNKNIRRYNGLVGLGAFSLRLRSRELNHYFTVLDCHIVLDFLYDAFLGKLDPVWLDSRFSNTKGGAPVPIYYIYNRYDLGVEYEFYELPL